MRTFGAPAELAGLDAGTELGASEWHTITQEMIDGFAQLTGDHQWIHVDRKRAAAGPFGGTVAHAYLVVALIPRLLDEVISVRDADVVLNKGMSRLKVTGPVPAGARIRAVVTVAAARLRPRGFVEVDYRLTVEVAGRAEPVLAAVPTYLYQSVPVPAGPHDQL